MKFYLLIAATALTLAFAACNGSDTPAGEETTSDNAACDYRAVTGATAGTCLEYSGTTYQLDAVKSGLQSSCESLSGAVYIATGGCPSAGRAGRCTSSPGDASEMISSYYDITWEAIQAACTSPNVPTQN